MNHVAFNEWYASHSAINPGFAAYMAKMTKDNPDQGASVLAEWARMMSDVDLHDATAASRKLRDRETQPRYERHPVEVRRIALELARPRETARFAFAGATVKCPRCHDTGFVEIFLVGEPLVRWLRLYGNKPRSIHAKNADEQGAVVRCDCAAGCSKASAIEQFDPKCHTLHVGSRRYASEDDQRWQQRDHEVDETEALLAERIEREA